MVDQTLQADAVAARGHYLQGVLFLVLSAVAYSSAGLFVRMIGRDAATILFWRGLFTIAAVVAFLIWRQGHSETRRQFFAMGRPGLYVALCQAVSMACFISSLQFTTVANNSIIFGTGPFMTAGLAWLMIRERPSVETITLSLVALAGALLVVGSSVMVSRASLAGDALAATSRNDHELDGREKRRANDPRARQAGQRPEGDFEPGRHSGDRTSSLRFGASAITTR